MKNNFKVLSAICLCLLLFATCKKSSNNPGAIPEQQNEDVINAKAESDNSDEDINTILSNLSAFGKNESVQSINICGASVDSSHENDSPPYIIITYNDTSCNGKKRSGQVTVQLLSGANWYSAGAELMVSYNNYKVISPSDNHSITFNGTKYITNAAGINWVNIVIQDSTVYQTRERTYNMTLTFDNGQTSPWNIARFSTWVLYFSNGGISAYTIARGDTAMNGDTIDTWGMTRWNTPFTVQVLQPWQANASCYWTPANGKYTSIDTSTSGFTITTTLGVNGNGASYSGSGCPYGFQINWDKSSNNSTGHATLPYWW